MITRRGVDPHGPPTARIRRCRYPLVMSAPNGFNVIPWADTDPLRRVNAATQAAIHDGYCAMKTDLLAIGQVSRQFMRGKSGAHYVLQIHTDLISQHLQSIALSSALASNLSSLLMSFGILFEFSTQAKTQQSLGTIMVNPSRLHYHAIPTRCMT